MLEYSIKNYIDDNGKEPIKEWLNSLDGTTRKRILLRFNRLKEGNFGDYKQIDNDLYELRFMFGSCYRVYYMLQGDLIILLINGGDKKSQEKDIKLAKRVVEYLKKGQ